MTEIPKDVWQTSMEVSEKLNFNAYGINRLVIARAILAERERCARIAERYSHGIYAAIAIRDE